MCEGDLLEGLARSRFNGVDIDECLDVGVPARGVRDDRRHRTSVPPGRPGQRPFSDNWRDRPYRSRGPAAGSAARPPYSPPAEVWRPPDPSWTRQPTLRAPGRWSAGALVRADARCRACAPAKIGTTNRVSDNNRECGSEQCRKTGYVRCSLIASSFSVLAAPPLARQAERRVAPGLGAQQRPRPTSRHRRGRVCRSLPSRGRSHVEALRPGRSADGQGHLVEGSILDQVAQRLGNFLERKGSIQGGAQSRCRRCVGHTFKVHLSPRLFISHASRDLGLASEWLR